LPPPEASLPKAFTTQLKESDMDKSTQTELDQQIVDLGDAKDLTMGIPNQVNSEDNPEVPHKLQP
jgi:hypothetical protein